ncbi:hypothetical protein V496_07394 [Pseudogymnoascus sp. VKM F-4515 (FW-2607)]|nr:hypothetical protein V496_07394 [Pseudogymnoascus sp. VKM F-4515 (FW-2607)]KFY78921.1 hypothetical protein V498_09020 [Pseudogymnoascus sp. VKM F-4517 (FW-2822)]
MNATPTKELSGYAHTVEGSTSTVSTDPSSEIDKRYDDETHPDGGLRAWLVVVGSFFLLFATFGFQTSVGLFQLHWSLNQLSDSSPSRIAWIPSVFIFLSLALSIQTGAIFDRYGARYILLFGSVGYFLTFILLAQCTSYVGFMLCLGVLGGVSSAALITVSQGVISHWFKKRRGQASGLAMLGSALGGVMFPLILKPLFEKSSWAWAMRILGSIVFLCLIPGNLFCRSRLLATSTSAVVNVRCYLDSTFNWLIISAVGFELLLITGLGLIPTYASDAGYGIKAGFYLIMTMNIGSTFGRVVPSWYSDRVGRFNMLLLMAVFTIASMLFIWLPFGLNSLVALYIFVFVYGFGTGSFVSLTMGCVGQICRGSDFARWVGALDSVVSIATLVSIPIGSSLQSNMGPQAMVWFLVSALSLALMACSISRAAYMGYKWRWNAMV